MLSQQEVTDVISKFIAYLSKVLPDDITAKLEELRAAETEGLAALVYETMFANQEAAKELNRPSCQDTGVIQFFAAVGTSFPLIDALPDIFKGAVLHATEDAPLRHNAVETFDEYNTGNNTGYRVPWVHWDIVPGSDELVLDIYMVGGGCTLPGKAMVLMPGAGYEGVVKFVLDVITSYGLNACPPLLVGVGIATSVETAAILSKKGAFTAHRLKEPERAGRHAGDRARRGHQ